MNRAGFCQHVATLQLAPTVAQQVRRDSRSRFRFRNLFAMRLKAPDACSPSARQHLHFVSQLHYAVVQGPCYDRPLPVHGKHSVDWKESMTAASAGRHVIQHSLECVQELIESLAGHSTHRDNGATRERRTRQHFSDLLSHEVRPLIVDAVDLC